jgi:anti-anti-sigma factor
MLTVTVQSLGDVPVLRCVGRIVRGDETALICATVQLQARNLILDLTEIDAIDAAGIGLLVSLQAAGFYLTLMNPTAHVREVLTVTKLDSILEICETRSTQDLMGEVAAHV